jgi:hypothetical protein
MHHPVARLSSCVYLLYFYILVTDYRFDMLDEPGDSARVKLPHPEVFNNITIYHT